MSRENVQIIRDGYEHYRATGEMREDFFAPDLVWDMSKFPGWVEQQTYLGADGAHEIVADWTNVWDDWEFEPDAFFDAGDKVVVIVRQHSRSQLTNVPVERVLAQVWTMREGKATRMEGYSDPDEALMAAGLA